MNSKAQGHVMPMSSEVKLLQDHEPQQGEKRTRPKDAKTQEEERQVRKRARRDDNPVDKLKASLTDAEMVISAHRGERRDLELAYDYVKKQHESLSGQWHRQSLHAQNLSSQLRDLEEASAQKEKQLQDCGHELKQQAEKIDLLETTLGIFKDTLGWQRAYLRQQSSIPIRDQEVARLSAKCSEHDNRLKDVTMTATFSFLGWHCIFPLELSFAQHAPTAVSEGLPTGARSGVGPETMSRGSTIIGEDVST